MATIGEIEDTFRSLDEQLRLEVLLDYANRLADPPDSLAGESEADTARVHECMTPVWLWLRRDDGGGVRLHAKIGPEAPTLRGIVSVIAAGYDGAAPDELANVPLDLVQRLGLAGVVRMNRMVGLTAMIERIRREAAALADESRAPAEGA